MEILVSNNNLEVAGGTQTFTYSLIEELLRQGHDVEYFCFKKGQFSKKIEEALNVKFCSKKKYDLILANHNTTVKALHRKGLIIQTIHGIQPGPETPSVLADAHVSVSVEVQNLLLQLGYSSCVIHNGIDCKRYKPLKPLAVKSPKVLSLCHSEEAHDMVEEACRLAGAQFGKLDKYIDAKWGVETIINEFDIVIGLGRSAFEAMACGRPVIIYDKRPYSDNLGDGYFLSCYPASIRNNCSGRALKNDLTADDLAAEINKYNPEHGKFARNIIVNAHNIETTVKQYLEYAELIKNRQKTNSVFEYLKRSFNEIRRSIFRIKLKKGEARMKLFGVTLIDQIGH